jgi:hypothetical protein
VYGPEASDSMGGFPSCPDKVFGGISAGLHPQELDHRPDSQEAKMPPLVSPHPSQCTRNVAGGGKKSQ